MLFNLCAVIYLAMPLHQELLWKMDILETILQWVMSSEIILSIASYFIDSVLAV